MHLYHLLATAPAPFEPPHAAMPGTVQGAMTLRAALFTFSAGCCLLTSGMEWHGGLSLHSSLKPGLWRKSCCAVQRSLLAALQKLANNLSESLGEALGASGC